MTTPNRKTLTSHGPWGRRRQCQECKSVSEESQFHTHSICPKCGGEGCFESVVCRWWDRFAGLNPTPVDSGWEIKGEEK